MSRRQQRSTKKSVTFAPSAKMRLHLHVNQYTQEEKQSYFYQTEDFQSFKADVKRTARMMEKKQKIDDESTWCTRGVERRTMQGAKICTKLRIKAMNSVFKEQMNQFFEDEDANGDSTTSPFECETKSTTNDEKLAAIYTECTRRAVASAAMTGLSDEVVAKEIWREYEMDKVFQKHPTSTSSSSSSVSSFERQKPRKTSSFTKKLMSFKRSPQTFQLRRDVFNSAA